MPKPSDLLPRNVHLIRVFVNLLIDLLRILIEVYAR